MGQELEESPLTETNGHGFLRRPGPTRGCGANDDDGTWIKKCWKAETVMGGWC
jgi:hypothetical protein